VILVPCGGGALLAGVAAAVKLSGLRQCRIYGVEPQGGKYRYILLLDQALISYHHHHRRHHHHHIATQIVVDLLLAA